MTLQNSSQTWNTKRFRQDSAFTKTSSVRHGFSLSRIDIMKKYHIVTNNTPNPLHDKRCKYGEKGIEVFKKGTIITEYVSSLNIAGIDVSISKYRIGNSGYFEKDVFKNIPTSEHELNPVEEFDTEYGNYRFENMVKEFISKGILKIEDIREYFNKAE